MCAVVKGSVRPLNEISQYSNSCHVGLVPSLGLGDSLIYLVLANNLALSGFQVTLISNHLAHFASWLPALRVIPFPPPEETGDLHKAFDLVLSDCGGIITNQDVKLEKLAEHHVFVGTLRVKPELIVDHFERVKRELGIEKALLLQSLSRCAGPIRVIDDDRATMVEQVVAFCREKLGLLQVSAAPGFVMPSDLNRRRFAKRVMLHPTSYNPKKNWPWRKYLLLARRLKAMGFDPEFVLSPKEREAWAGYFKNEFAIPEFANARELGTYLYESGYVIGNDSGVGHLASALGIPVLTIYRKRRDGFCWRPGWGESNRVVRPVLSLGAYRHAWGYFLPVGRVVQEFKKMLTQNI